MGFGRGMEDGGGEETEIAYRSRNVHRPGQADRFPGIARLQQGQLVQVPFDQLGDPEENPGTFNRRLVGPGWKRPGRGLHGAVHICLTTVRDLGKLASGGRFDPGQVLAGGRGNLIAVYVVSNPVHDRGKYSRTRGKAIQPAVEELR